MQKEIEKLRGYLNEGKFGFHRTYTGVLKTGIENLKKQIPECDKRIDYYKNNLKNNINNNYNIGILERLKTSISKLVSDYEKNNK